PASPPAPPRPWAGHHVDVLAYRPQIDDIGREPREAIVVSADAPRFVAVDAARERHLTVLLEERRAVKAGAACDEPAGDFVGFPVRAAAGVETRRQHLEAGVVLAGLDRYDAAAPAHDG